MAFSFVSCDFAQNLLYPLKEANEVAVPDVPPAGYSQAILEVSHRNKKEQVHFWYFEQSKTNAPVLLFFHGQGENIGNPRMRSLLKYFENTGYHFVLMDYPGYGKSTGVPSQNTILADTDVVFSWIQKHFKQSKIYSFGWSLGAAVAAQVANLHQKDLAGFILASPWTSLEDLIESYGTPAPPEDQWFDDNKWDSEQAAKTTNLPGLIVHGDQDKTIPFELGARLAFFYSQGQFIPVSGADHVDTINSPKLWTSIKDFVGN